MTENPETFLTPADHAFADAVTPDSELWERVRIKSADRRHVAGHGPMLTFKRSRPAPANRGIGRSTPAWHSDRDPLRDIPADVYLEALAPDSTPARGRCHCPLPDHEDRNPSATYRDAVWFCHRCGQGGDIYKLGAIVLDLPDRGPGFLELRQELARRLLGEIA